MEISYGIYTVESAYAYLPPGTVLFLLSILSFLVRSGTKKSIQKNYTFPIVGITSLLGGMIFLTCHLMQVPPGFTPAILAGLSGLLIIFWVSRTLLNPNPNPDIKRKTIQPKDRHNYKEHLAPARPKTKTKKNSSKSKVNRKTKPRAKISTGPLDELEPFIGDEDDQQPLK